VFLKGETRLLRFESFGVTRSSDWYVETDTRKKIGTVNATTQCIIRVFNYSFDTLVYYNPSFGESGHQ